MASRPTGRPVGRQPRDYDRPPPPREMQMKCPKCERHSMVLVSDALYAIDKAVPTCPGCGTKLF